MQNGSHQVALSSLEVLDFVLQFVVDAGLEVVLVLVVLRLLPLLPLRPPALHLALAVVAEPLVDPQGLLVDGLVLEFGLLDPDVGGEGEEVAEVAAQVRTAHDVGDELVVVAGLLHQSAQLVRAFLQLLALQLQFPQVVRERSHHVLRDVLLVPASRPAPLPEQHHLRPSLPGLLLLLPAGEGPGGQGEGRGEGVVVLDGEGVVGEAEGEQLADDVVGEGGRQAEQLVEGGLLGVGFAHGLGGGEEAVEGAEVEELSLGGGRGGGRVWQHFHQFDSYVPQ